MLVKRIGIFIIVKQEAIMDLIKQNYLQIKYQSKKGMVLNWNFKDLHQIHNYYHHLLILVSPRGKTNQGLLEQYYKRMKFGDLISFAYISTSNTPKIMNWIEKTQLASLQVSKIMDRNTIDPLSAQLEQNLIQFAANWTTENNNINVVTNFLFCLQDRQKSDYYVKKIINLRQDGAFSYHCGLFNLCLYNKISFSNGIHFLNTGTRDIFQVLSLYHTIINSAAVRFAKVTIDCSNGQMMSYDTQIWHNSDFSRIQRNFYGPSINYLEDIIQFHVLDAFDDAEFDMIINLELQLFSGQLVCNSKRIKISFQNERHYDKSLNLTNLEPVLTYQGVDIRSNPFATSTFVRLMRSSCQDFSEIKEKLEVACRTTKRTRERTTADRMTKPQSQKQNFRRKPVEYFYPSKKQEENQQFLV